MAKNRRHDRCDFEIRHRFELRHPVFVIFCVETATREGPAIISHYRAALTLRISRASGRDLEHPVVEPELRVESATVFSPAVGPGWLS